MPNIYIASNKPRVGKTSVAISIATKLMESNKETVLVKPVSIGESPSIDDMDGVILREVNANAIVNSIDWPLLTSSNPKENVTLIDQGIKIINDIDSSVFTVVEGLSGLNGDIGNTSKIIADKLNARVVVVLGYDELEIVSACIDAQSSFGDRLVGVIINGVTRYKVRETKQLIISKIESEGIKVLAVIPEHRKLLGTTVNELAEHLSGEIISWKEKGDNFIDNYLIGGNVLDWGVFYFERYLNKAVIVRGDRPDIQMAALQTETSCLVLTGGHDPIEYVAYEAREEEVPIIKVATDTFSTTMALESLQGKSLFGHPVKKKIFADLMDQNADTNMFDSLLSF